MVQSKQIKSKPGAPGGPSGQLFAAGAHSEHYFQLYYVKLKQSFPLTALNPRDALLVVDILPFLVANCPFGFALWSRKRRSLDHLPGRINYCLINF